MASTTFPVEKDGRFKTSRRTSVVYLTCGPPTHTRTSDKMIPAVFSDYQNPSSDVDSKTFLSFRARSGRLFFLQT